MYTLEEALTDELKQKGTSELKQEAQKYKREFHRLYEIFIIKGLHRDDPRIWAAIPKKRKYYRVIRILLAQRGVEISELHSCTKSFSIPVDTE